MEITTVSGKEREPLVAAIILRRINGGVYICTCSVRYDGYKCNTKHEFIFQSQFKPLHQLKCCRVLINNRSDAPICVLKDK